MHVEHLILNAHDFAETQGDMPAHHDVAVIGGGRLIERTCGFGTPVGQNRLMVRARQADAADVMTVAVLGVETTKHQPILNAAQLREAVFVHCGKGVSFAALRGGSVGAGGAYGVQALPHFGSQIIQSSIGAIDGLLLLMQLGGVTRHAVLFVPFPWGRKNLRHSNLPHTPYVSDADNPE